MENTLVMHIVSKIIIAIMITNFLSVNVAYSHGGGLDRFGCHVESATGIRHCHSGSSSSSGGGGGSSEDDDLDKKLLIAVGALVVLYGVICILRHTNEENSNFEKVGFQFEKNNGNTEGKIKFKFLEF